MKHRATPAIAAAALLIVTGCGSKDEETKAAPVRPVLSVVVEPAGDRQVGFAGTIEPRYQTERGFRVLGRMIARNVDVGDLVKVGQKLAQIDPLVFELAVRSNEADLAKARSQLSKTAAAEDRAQILVQRQASSQADLDAAEQSREASAAAVQQAEAELAKAREQLGYTTLTADIDGVVTSTDADVGQVASPGKKVMTLARTDHRDAVVDLPEDVLRSVGEGTPFTIRLQADMSIEMNGKVREIAPEADAATRTRRVKITLDQAVDPFRLGATITAIPVAAASPPTLDLPRSALLERDGGTLVWLVDPAAKTVRTVLVEVARSDNGIVQIAGGLEPGARVVIAGVHSLAEGQAVRIEERPAE